MAVDLPFGMPAFLDFDNHFAKRLSDAQKSNLFTFLKQYIKKSEFKDCILFITHAVMFLSKEMLNLDFYQ